MDPVVPLAFAPGGTGKGSNRVGYRGDLLELLTTLAKHGLANPVHLANSLGPGGRLSTGSGRQEPAGRLC